MIFGYTKFHWYVLIFYLSLVGLWVHGTIDNKSTTSKKSPYNVILLVFDDMRPAIGGYGDRLAYTPNLDNFMNKSFYFTRTYSQQALCAPSRNSMLTSRRPDTLHLYDFYSYWRTFTANYTTLPQYFKEHGYYTYSVGKVFHPGISSNNSDDYPISWSARPFRPKTEKFMNSPVCPDKTGILKKNLICPVHLQTQPYKTLPDIESVSEAIRFVQSKDFKHKPYFLALGLHKPHINFRFPKQFLEYFRLGDFYNYTNDIEKPYDMPNVAWNPYTDLRSRDDFKHQKIPFPFGPISEEQSAEIRQAYYASIAYVDDLFGKFIASVNLTNTIVMVTSDHGWSLGEHAEWAKYSNFEVALRVPLILHTPEFQLNQSTKLDTITELVDIFPTLVSLAHLPSLIVCNSTRNTNLAIPTSAQLTCTEGKSLYPQLAGTSQEEEYIALSQYPRPGIQPTKHPNSDKPKLKNIKVMGYSMRTNHFRYTFWIRFYASNFSRDFSDVFGEEMYDHRLNNREEVNLVQLPEFDHIRKSLKQKLISALGK